MMAPNTHYERLTQSWHNGLLMPGLPQLARTHRAFVRCTCLLSEFVGWLRVTSRILEAEYLADDSAFSAWILELGQQAARANISSASEGQCLYKVMFERHSDVHVLQQELLKIKELHLLGLHH